MQKFRYISDVHNSYIEGEEDCVLIVAGDWTEFKKGSAVTRVEETCKRFKAVVHVPGNHEYYGGSLTRSLKSFKERTEHIENYHLLEDETIEFGDVLIAGCTMWTDLWGYEQHDFPMMNDYKYIRTGPQVDPYKWKARIIDTTAKHWESKKFLESIDTDRKCIFVTHHAPSAKSIHRDYEGDPYNPCYFTEMTPRPDVWVHGHVHQVWDYLLDDTRVLCNPVGYNSEQTWFDPNAYFEL